MNIPILKTKLYIPPTRSTVVFRSRLIGRLNEGLQRKLTLVSASAGFGKTTLISEWLATCNRPSAWLSLDEGDNDSNRFLSYFIAALHTILPNIGDGLLEVLQSNQPPSTESILTHLLNEITSFTDGFVFVFDDYQVINAVQVDNALNFLIEHKPPNMHVVIVTREDPHLSLARLRVQNQLNELRISDLRFTNSETAEFLNSIMSLNLSPEDIELLDSRTEGWIAGLQLAAISLQGQKEATNFIKSFSGSNRYVLDFLMEEVLKKQPEGIQTFLLNTSILDRLSGPLCDAILDGRGLGQKTLEYLEHANLFIIPLDNVRLWYRYHHLFSDLLRQRLLLSNSSSSTDKSKVSELHIKASIWFEDNGFEVEALHHAAIAKDVKRASRIVEGKGMPLHYRGAVAPVINWLESQPRSVLDSNPSLWVVYCSALLFANRLSGIEQKFQAAEEAIQCCELNEKTRDLLGHVAQLRANYAVSQHNVETIIAQAQRALDYLHSHNLPVRSATNWSLGYAYYLKGDRAAANQYYSQAFDLSITMGHKLITILATSGIGHIQEVDNKLHLAVETYLKVLQLAGDPPIPISCQAHLGLARIYLEWDDKEKALYHGERANQLASQIETTDRYISCEVFLARLKLVKGDLAGAVADLDRLIQLVQFHNFTHQIPEIVATQVLILLKQGNLLVAAQLAEAYELPISQIRVHLAMGETSTALEKLRLLREQVEEKGWMDEILKIMVLHSLVLQAHGEKAKAARELISALELAEPAGFLRIFLDEGEKMAELLNEIISAADIEMSEYLVKLQSAFIAEGVRDFSGNIGNKFEIRSETSKITLIEPLTERELKVLQLIAQGLSNREISERLFVALSTVKGHNQNIFAKLQVQRRTEALIRARELGLL